LVLTTLLTLSIRISIAALLIPVTRRLHRGQASPSPPSNPSQAHITPAHQFDARPTPKICRLDQSPSAALLITGDEKTSSAPSFTLTTVQPRPSSYRTTTSIRRPADTQNLPSRSISSGIRPVRSLISTES
ncbi:hypothetical protein LINGRAHAP2_LOCUS1984, partial [Linum grandiflorum]